MTPSQIRELATIGAKERVRELQAELSSIRSAFPELVTTRSTTKTPKVKVVQLSTEEEAAVTVSKMKRKWSAAARRAVSVRMKKYWAGRRRKVKG